MTKPHTISPATIDAIHAAFDYRPPSAAEIVANIQRAYARRVGTWDLPGAKPAPPVRKRKRQPAGKRRAKGRAAR